MHSKECNSQPDVSKYNKLINSQETNKNCNETAIAVVLDTIEANSGRIEEFSSIIWDQNEVIIESEDLTKESGETLQLTVEQISGTHQYHLVNVPRAGNMVNYSVESVEEGAFTAQLLQ